MQKNKTWKPTTSLHTLQRRAKVLSDIRAFFDSRGVLEVETPLMCQGVATDPYIQSFSVSYASAQCAETRALYLQTSPEFAMKRLLAAGSGPIYQISKAFRNEEEGRLHNPEFTILEWYQPGFDHHALMDEMEALLSRVLETKTSDRFSYKAIFENILGIDPHSASLAQLKHCAVSKGIILSPTLVNSLSIDDYLDILMTHCIEPHLGSEVPAMIYDFPASKAALAKVRSTEEIPVAERFEVYFKGIELANGYHELNDPDIQLARLQADCERRKTLGYPEVPIDHYLIEALRAGLPDSAGVALGVDRLLMLKLGSHEIQEVIPFTIDRA